MILYPWLVAVLPLFTLYRHNLSELTPLDLAGPLAAVLALTAVLLAVLRRILGAPLAAAFTALFHLCLSSYGPALHLLAQWAGTGGALSRHRVFLPLYLAAFLLLAAALYRLRERLGRSGRRLDVLAGILVASLLIQIGIGLRSARPGPPPDRPGVSGLAPLEGEPGSAEGRSPDIFFLVLDAYAGEELLRDRFGFDNGEFLASLRARGFEVARKGRSNYAMTGMSLSSTLNLDYVARDTGQRDPAWTRPSAYFRRAIEENRLTAFLKSRGYAIIHFDSGEWITAGNRHADSSIQHGLYSEFHRLILGQTVVSPLAERFLTDKRRRIRGILDHLVRLAPRGEKPKFVFAHILVPHPPFVFGPRGENAFVLSSGDGWNPSQTRAYLDQVAFVNGRIQGFLDALQASGNPAVVVIQGDHGPAFSQKAMMLSGWEGRPGVELVQERMSILNAIRLPDGEPGAVPEGMTPVNTFRLVLDRYFGTALGRLEDRSYFSRYAEPFSLVDVTEDFLRFGAESGGSIPDLTPAMPWP